MQSGEIGGACHCTLERSQDCGKAAKVVLQRYKVGAKGESLGRQTFLHHAKEKPRIKLT
jgi:hypothetical protein